MLIVAAERFILDPGVRALLHDLHIPESRVLTRAKLPAGLIQFQSGPVALTTDEYFRFWEALEAEASNPNLAVAIGQVLMGRESVSEAKRRERLD